MRSFLQMFLLHSLKEKMMYPGDEVLEKKDHKIFAILAIFILAIMLLISTVVEISYYNDIKHTLNGVEHERDFLRTDNNMLRNEVLQKLEDNNRIMRGLADASSNKPRHNGHE